MRNVVCIFSHKSCLLTWKGFTAATVRVRKTTLSALTKHAPVGERCRRPCFFCSHNILSGLWLMHRCSWSYWKADSGAAVQANLPSWDARVTGRGLGWLDAFALTIARCAQSERVSSHPAPVWIYPTVAHKWGYISACFSPASTSAAFITVCVKVSWGLMTKTAV